MLIPFGDLVHKYGVRPKRILHVGAHLAEESEAYQEHGIGNVVWIEANPALIQALKDRVARLSDNHVFNLLVSDTAGEDVSFYITNNTQSSSLLPLGRHRTFHPQVEVASEIRLKTTRLYDFFDQQPELTRNLDFVNMDIQGADLPALHGLAEKLDQFQWVYCEANVGSVYEGCATLLALDDFFSSKGFWRVATKMTNWMWGDVLYARMDWPRRRHLLEMAKTYVEYAVYMSIGFAYYLRASLHAKSRQ